MPLTQIIDIIAVCSDDIVRATVYELAGGRVHLRPTDASKFEHPELYGGLGSVTRGCDSKTVVCFALIDSYMGAPALRATVFHDNKMLYQNVLTPKSEILEFEKALDIVREYESAKENNLCHTSFPG